MMLQTHLLKNGLNSALTWEPHIAKPTMLLTNTILHCQLLALRRILRTLGLLWSSLVMNRCCYASTIPSVSLPSTSFFNYLENRFRCKGG
jgi:hypothetical protein